MKKGEIYEGTVERIEFPNKGVVVIDGEKAIVKNALPGQKVSCMVQKVHKNKSEARLLEVLEEAPDAVKSPCPHFGTSRTSISQQRLTAPACATRSLECGASPAASTSYGSEARASRPKPS